MALVKYMLGLITILAQGTSQNYIAYMSTFPGIPGSVQDTKLHIHTNIHGNMLKEPNITLHVSNNF
eukprot:6248416-Ditylum_brightwellii.AAC.1